MFYVSGMLSGGAIEMHLSKILRDYSRTIAGKEQLLIAAIAKALEVIPRQLCDNAGFDATNILNKLRQKHAQEKCFYSPVNKINNNVQNSSWRKVSGFKKFVYVWLQVYFNSIFTVRLLPPVSAYWESAIIIFILNPEDLVKLVSKHLYNGALANGVHFRSIIRLTHSGIQSSLAES
uniref:T-complex protein 1 subunit eta n=1 Tax=Glossina brevipalpis TaxID=37001 RepID=A0A1A9W6R2_9MUSC